MSENLSDHYDKMWESSRELFNNGICEVDPLIDDQKDNRRGVTLLARPGRELLDQIILLQNELRQIEPDQYYQPIKDLHLTILSIISCFAGFQLNHIEPKHYQQIVQECLKEPFIIKYKGVTASSSGILIQGFPENDGLLLLRDQLRKKFKNSDVQHSIDSRYKISTAHITVMRFRKDLTQPKELVRALDKFRNHSFGSMTINQLYLVFNDWYQRREIVKDLATFALS